MLPNLGLEHHLHCDRGLGYLGDLLLQLCAKRNKMGLSAKENEPNRGGSLRDSPSAFSSQRWAVTREALAFSFQPWASTREASAFSFRRWASTRVASAAL